MTALISEPLTLENFLKIPETKPASEYIDVDTPTGEPRGILLSTP
jgi:hypothetical protein